jgi:hypothetical protein
MPPDPQGSFWWLARTLRPGIFPDWTIRPIWAFVYIVHFAEGLYGASLARKHNMPWHIAVSVPLFSFALAADPDLGFPQTAWVGAVTIFGFPVLLRLHRLIQQARIESIMKGH